MISAMPAVAVRRERRRSKTGSKLAGSHQGSMTSLPVRPKGGNSFSTLDSVGRRQFPSVILQEERARVLMYIGTLLLVAGLVLLFIGVGATVRYTQTVGLLFIAGGALLCLLKVFLTPENSATIVRKARLIGSRDSLYSVAPVDIKTRESLREEPENEAKREASKTESETGTPPMKISNSVTPTSVNGANETQVLIPEKDDKDRF